jgi:TolB-like protein/DNA-binding winged helix-turn-helix (wHTH) protein/Tfp pilus assembly protein PilF
MAEVSQLSRTVRFGAYELDLRTAQLKKYGLRVKLQRQPAQVLVLLVTRLGEVVTREQLRDHLWRDDTFVDFDHGLNNSINRVREVLCDSVAEPRFIETIPKTGYRFIGEVEEVGVSNLRPLPAQVVSLADVSVGGPLLDSGPSVIRGDEARAGIIGRFGRGAALAVVLSLTLGMSGGIAKSLQPSVRSLVVLPFENLSGDPSQDYFAEGMTDALITDLARTGSLQVISRTSAMHYKGSHLSLPEIARELNVDAVVEGGVMRSGGRVRISAQLIQAASDRNLWARAYERDAQEVLPLQREVAQSIVTEIRAKMAATVNTGGSGRETANSEAYEAYLKGKFFTHQPGTPDFERGIGYLRQASQLDPNFALSHATLADSYGWDGSTLEDARREAETALAMDETLAEGHTALAWVKFRADWDFAGAESEYRRALELNPRYVEAREAFGLFLAYQGRLPEAFAELEAARHLDPISSKLNMLYGLALYCDRRYDESLEKFLKALELAPGAVNIQRHMFRAYEQKGDLRSAIEMFPEAAAWWGESHENAVRQAEELRKSYEKSGASAYWEKRVEIETRNHVEFDKFRLSLMYVHLGEHERALTLLQQLYGEHSDALPMWLKSDPQYDPIRSEPRYQALLREMGFPPDAGANRLTAQH